MFLRKQDGPRAVTMPDGSVMTRADLPAMGTTRWVASRKAAVVRGVLGGLITRAQAIEWSGLSDDEFDEWLGAIAVAGLQGLKTTYAKKNRQPKGESRSLSGINRRVTNFVHVIAQLP